MSMINVSNLSFSYDGSWDNIFDNVSFTIDTNWKLGFIGRNGRGKTTFLNLLMGKYEYDGQIKADVNFDYFPFEVKNKKLNSYEIAKLINPEFEVDYEGWRLEREVSLLEMDDEILTRPFETLSKGEQTKVLLAILFLKENNFLLIDEPTNHLDVGAREAVAKYLKSKKSFILVSHDRKFLDACIDHVLSINRSNIEVQQGNFSSWWENKTRQDNFELSENEILKEKGYIRHKTAKMMKRSIAAQNRKEQAIEEKSKLLKNIETMEELKLNPLEFRGNRLIEANGLSIFYGDNILFEDLNFYVESGDRVQLAGKNGCGKSSIIKLLLGENIQYNGQFYIPKDLKISYVSQDTSYLRGSLSEIAEKYDIDESLFKSILRKLGFERVQFEKNVENYSEGQKKKVLIAKSLCEQAHLYIWDEPLNYIDVISRMQIEDLILNYNPTMIFVEHDETFSEKVATQKLVITRNNENTKGRFRYLAT